MDPDANLTEQLRLANQLVWASDTEARHLRHEAERLAELVIALDEWIRRGGALPADWRGR